MTKSQDEQLNLIQNLNLKLKAASNLHEIEKTNFESSIKALNNEIKKLLDQMKPKNKEEEKVFMKVIIQTVNAKINYLINNIICQYEEEV